MTINEMVAMIKKSGLFDEAYYLKMYGDVKRAKYDPVLHYVNHGAKEGRDPSADFDTKAYVKQHPHVTMNPLVHYIIHGEHVIVGMCRYSLEKAFEWSVNVFEEPYFSKRLRMFETITLRSLDEQTEKNFVLLAYHSESCPTDKRLILKKLEEKHPYLINVFVKGGMPLPDYVATPHLLTFRLDNDDGLPKNFIARLNEVRYMLENRNAPDTVITSPPILMVAKLSEDKFIYRKRHFPFNSMGLAMYSATGFTITSAGNHTKVKDKFPWVNLPGQGGLQILHDSNVLNGTSGFEGEFLNRKEISELLASLGYPLLELSKLPLYDKEVRT